MPKDHLLRRIDRFLDLSDLRERSLSLLRSEFLLAATVQNLRRLTKVLGSGTPPATVGT